MDNNDFSNKKRNTITYIDIKNTLPNNEEIGHKLNFFSSASENHLSNNENLDNFLKIVGKDAFKSKIPLKYRLKKKYIHTKFF
jgi:hypothetical protein